MWTIFSVAASGRDTKNEQRVAAAYAQSLNHGLFSALARPGSEAALTALKEEFDKTGDAAAKTPTLGWLFQMEARLFAIIDESQIDARLWALEERFRRFIPRRLVDKLEQHFSKPADSNDGPQSGADHPQGLRRQALALLDIAHSHVLFGIAREHTLRRLQFRLTATAVIVVLVLFAMGAMTTHSAFLPLTLCAIAGIGGAYCSTMQRLQTEGNQRANPTDAFSDLLVYATGYRSIISSVMLGGLFGTVLYVIVQSGYMHQLAPGGRAEMSGSNESIKERVQAAASTQLDGLTVQAVAPADARPTTVLDSTDGAQVKTWTWWDVQDRIIDAVRDAGRAIGEPSEPPFDPKACLLVGSSGCGGLRALVAGPMLWSVSDYFKMILLAFVAGFFERFVPDILSKVAARRKEEVV